MKTLARIAVISAIGLTAQPCLAAAVDSNGASVAAPIAAPGAAHAHFDLERHVSSAGIASMTLAASQQTASEVQEQPKRKGPGTTTWLIVGGVALLVLVVVAASAASPGPGPGEGAFD